MLVSSLSSCTCSVEAEMASAARWTPIMDTDKVLIGMCTTGCIPEDSQADDRLRLLPLSHLGNLLGLLLLLEVGTQIPG